ncbi:hypothetical protein CEXT_115121 [Caerostris extrusa]|uniref:Uncharacterized protein n=1 Tax=Caerostris extrusa TaxID=172846 RepID=A0AAV4R8D8_CAEEX|nr:hypothetical protein CEXT_115121 [Caerostris extrusa]
MWYFVRHHSVDGENLFNAEEPPLRRLNYVHSRKPYALLCITSFSSILCKIVYFKAIYVTWRKSTSCDTEKSTLTLIKDLVQCDGCRQKTELRMIIHIDNKDSLIDANEKGLSTSKYVYSNNVQIKLSEQKVGIAIWVRCTIKRDSHLIASYYSEWIRVSVPFKRCATDTEAVDSGHEWVQRVDFNLG